MSDLPEPLTSATVDLRVYPYMPLDVVRLRDSDLAALNTGDEFRAAVLLWCAAWHQVPAGSLPDNDRILARLAGYGRDLRAWKRVKGAALHGFVLCTDGRLYHPVICDKAIEAWTQREQRREAGRASARARSGQVTEKHENAANERSNGDANDVGTGPSPPVGTKSQSPVQQNKLEENKTGRGRKKTSRKNSKRIRSLEDLSVDDDLRAWARKNCPDVYLDAELEKFLNHVRANGRELKDYRYGLRNWCLKGQEFFEERRALGNGSGPVPGVHEAADPRDLWRPRIASWWNDGSPDPRRWLGTWGMRPDEPDCTAPPDIVMEITGRALSDLGRAE